MSDLEAHRRVMIFPPSTQVAEAADFHPNASTGGHHEVTDVDSQSKRKRSAGLFSAIPAIPLGDDAIHAYGVTDQLVVLRESTAFRP